MDENELHELDAWIAEHLYGKSITDIEDYDIAETFKPSSDPTDFADVKREITKKGWNWESKAIWVRELTDEPDSVFYLFRIYKPQDEIPTRTSHYILIGHAGAKSEELAGCRAVQFAMGGGTVIVIDS